MSKVSIIIPVHNSEKTLDKCVQSVLNQNFHDFEVILIDDGSEDTSLAICKKYAQQDGRVQVISKQSGGASSARNRGLAVATGEWVTFIDSDDYINAEFLDGIDNHNEDVLFCGYTKIFKTDIYSFDPAKEFGDMNLHGIISNFCEYQIMRTPWAKIYKRSLIGDLRFNETMRIAEDTQFLFYYLACCNTFGMMENSCYFYVKPMSPEHIRYAVTVNYAAQCLSLLRDAFEKMARKHQVSKRVFIIFILYFRYISMNSWDGNPKLWYGNEGIRDEFRYVWKELPLSRKIRAFVARIFNR